MVGDIEGVDVCVPLGDGEEETVAEVDADAEGVAVAVPYEG